ncbi:MAG: hypothetical protein ACYTEO_19295, partial [Planctomycetota bacterium]
MKIGFFMLSAAVVWPFANWEGGVLIFAGCAVPIKGRPLVFNSNFWKGDENEKQNKTKYRPDNNGSLAGSAGYV